MVNQRTLSVFNVLLYSSYFFGFGATVLFLMMYLRTLGFSSFSIGLVFCLGNAIGALVQEISSRISDSSHVFTLRVLGFLHTGLMLLSMIAVLFGALPHWAIWAVFIFYYALLTSTQAIITAITIAFETAGHGIRFNQIRACGSASYALTVVLLGQFFHSAPITRLPYFLIASCTLILVLLCALPAIPAGRSGHLDPRIQGKIKPTDRFYHRYPVLIPLMVGFSLLFCSHTYLNNFLSSIITYFGGSSAEVGVAGMIATLAEIPAIYYYNKMQQRWKNTALLTFSAILFTVKCALLLGAVRPTDVYFSQALQFGAFGLFGAGFSYLVTEIVEPQDLVKGQSAATVVMSIGGALSGIIGGSALQYIGSMPTLYLMTGISLLGTGSVLYGIHQTKKYFKQKQVEGKV